MSLETLKEKLLSDSGVKAHYDAIKLVKDLVKLRKDLGLTQRDLAERTGIKQSQIARMESERCEPKLTTLFFIADSLGYSLEFTFVNKSKKKQ